MKNFPKLVLIVCAACFSSELSGQEIGHFFRFNGGEVFENDRHVPYSVGEHLLFQELVESGVQFRIICLEGEVTELFYGFLSESSVGVEKRVVEQRRDSADKTRSVKLTTFRIDLTPNDFWKIYNLIETVSDSASFLEDTSAVDFSTLYYVGVIDESGFRKSAWSCRVKIVPGSDREKFDEIFQFLSELNFKPTPSESK